MLRKVTRLHTLLLCAPYTSHSLYICSRSCNIDHACKYINTYTHLVSSHVHPYNCYIVENMFLGIRNLNIVSRNWIILWYLGTRPRSVLERWLDADQFDCRAHIPHKKIVEIYLIGSCTHQ